MPKQERSPSQKITPIPPAVEPGQEGPAYQERRWRLLKRGIDHAVGAFYYEGWRHQAETGEGVGFRDGEEGDSAQSRKQRPLLSQRP